MLFLKNHKPFILKQSNSRFFTSKITDLYHLNTQFSLFISKITMMILQKCFINNNIIKKLFRK